MFHEVLHMSFNYSVSRRTARTYLGAETAPFRVQTAVATRGVTARGVRINCSYHLHEKVFLGRKEPRLTYSFLAL